MARATHDPTRGLSSGRARTTSRCSARSEPTCVCRTAPSASVRFATRSMSRSCRPILPASPRRLRSMASPSSRHDLHRHHAPPLQAPALGAEGGRAGREDHRAGGQSIGTPREIPRGPKRTSSRRAEAEGAACRRHDTRIGVPCCGRVKSGSAEYVDRNADYRRRGIPRHHRGGQGDHYRTRNLTPAVPPPSDTHGCFTSAAGSRCSAA
jgi:hypothetical protein